METKVYLDYVESGLKECCDKFFYDNSCVAKAAEYSLLNGEQGRYSFFSRGICVVPTGKNHCIVPAALR